MKKDEFALITASSKGLGKAIALAFAEEGYNIILNGRNDEYIYSAKKEIDSKGVGVVVVKGDIRDKKVLDNFYQIASTRNTSILVNNAAIPCCGKPLEQLTDEYINENVGINLIAQLKLTRRLYSIFVENGYGTIININSIVGIELKEYRSIHSASKWGLRGFTESLRIEANKKGIRIIEVYPTSIMTNPEHKFGMNPDDVAKKIVDNYINKTTDELTIDGRPPEFRPGYKG